MRKVLTSALVAGAALALCGVTMAAPIAPHAPISKLGKKIMAAEHKTQIAECPDAASVGIPAYPDSLCVGVAKVEVKGAPPGREPLPRLSLVSKTPVAKVKQWYADRLKGWKYDPKLKHFVHPGWTFRRFMSEPAVIVKAATKTSLAFYAMVFDLSDAKTLITIAYKPKGAGK